MSSATRHRRLILLRHGQTEWNADNRMQGQLDTQLTELGRSQAKDAAQALADLPITAIVSSDLHRAYDTATALGDVTGVPVRTDVRLRETHLGEWQGLVHTQVDERYPGQRETWRGDARFAPPGGESRVEVAARSIQVVRELLDTDYDGVAVLVAHGGLIAALSAALLDLPVDRWPVLGGLDNTSWVQLTEHETIGWRLNVWNSSARVAGDVL
ncbi:histidine phosphatase family protein [Aldersonia sp. NBC_00410]|uniref:histidine phosphatase family protein n=1 Tax=Aldersonia sp. NBC_00410 TaxID=2975954 RepID=UPI002256C342|nr:histidine phosphatase family protein [Aldersonia sp. NBC_00410]MCX5042764.1 histidine phosphatase family protein [Aldersonia sp. NBC_00410]